MSNSTQNLSRVNSFLRPAKRELRRDDLHEALIVQGDLDRGRAQRTHPELADQLVDEDLGILGDGHTRDILVTMASFIPPLVQLARIRRTMGISAAKLGKAAGLGQQYISQLERGLRPKTDKEVAAIARALDVSVAALTSEDITLHCDADGTVTVTC